MNQQNVEFCVINKSASISAMRQTNNQVNCKSSVKSSVKSASVQQSGQRQVIGQTNVNPTSENPPRPKNRKNGERLTPIASDRPAEPMLRRWRDGESSRTMQRQVWQPEMLSGHMMEAQRRFAFEQASL